METMVASVAVVADADDAADDAARHPQMIADADETPPLPVVVVVVVVEPL